MAEVYKVNISVIFSFRTLNLVYYLAKINENSSEIWPWREHLRLCGTCIGSVQVDKLCNSFYSSSVFVGRYLIWFELIARNDDYLKEPCAEALKRIKLYSDSLARYGTFCSKWALFVEILLLFKRSCQLNMCDVKPCRKVALPLSPLWTGRVASGDIIRWDKITLCNIFVLIWRDDFCIFKILICQSWPGLCTLVCYLWRNLHAGQTNWWDCLWGRKGRVV